MNILVTGGAGYIGSHTCKLLKERGHTPVVLDNLTYGHEYAVQWGPLIRADIRDQHTVEQVIRDHKIEAIIHFAAFTYVGESVREPLKYYDNNFVGTLEFLKAVLKTSVRRIVFSSTCAVYGIPNRVPITEDEKRSPINPYGHTKLMVEGLLQSLSLSHGLGAVALRYFNAAGADRDGKVGEDHNPETHLIPLAIQAAFDPGYELTVFGDNYDTEDGTCIRDYIHVTDLAEAHLAAVDFLMEGSPSFTAYNVGAGYGASVKQIIAEVERVSGKRVKYKIGARRAGDPDRLVANCEHLKLQFNWQPQHSSLENVITTAVAWYRKQKR